MKTETIKTQIKFILKMNLKLIGMKGKEQNCSLYELFKFFFKIFIMSGINNTCHEDGARLGMSTIS